MNQNNQLTKAEKKEVQEEKSLKDGECIIETDSQMMDCSFHTQLKNMTDTLRLLAQSH